jgi:hypothetical protein
MRNMIRLFTILLSFFLFSILIGCMLDTSGLAPVSPVSLDSDFHGCFEKEDDPSGQIIIIQERDNLLRGTGFGLFNGPNSGWTFTGRVTRERVAILHITMEGESRFDVDATRPSPDPPDDLTLQRSGYPVLILTRCD